MFHRKSEKGQALILIALAAIGLFAFAALAIDGSRAYSDKRHAQNTADTSVLAAALASIRCEPCTAVQKRTAAINAAQLRATSNGYSHDNPIPGQEEVKVYVNLCSEAGSTDPATGWKVPACEGVEAGHESEYIRVRIVSTIPATFGRVIGRRTIIGAAEAIARVTGGSGGSANWPFTGAGMVSTKSGNYDKCLMMNGGGDLQIHGAGIVINCTHKDAWWMDGNSSLVMDANGKVAGCWKENGSANWDEKTDPIDCWQTPKVYTAADFASVPTSDPVPACGTTPGTIASGSSNADPISGSSPSLTVKKNTVVINPGNWSAILVTGGTLKMNPGVYCINGGFSSHAGATIVNNQATGPVQLVMGNNDFILGSGSSASFPDVEFYFNNGSYKQNANSSFTTTGTTNRLRIFTTGSGGVDTNSQCTLTSNNAYIYLKAGDIQWNAQTTLHLEAPKSPDKYAGLVVYKPWGNTVETKFNGGSNVYLKGTFLAPTTHIIYNGGSDWELHAQVIADSFLVNGNTDVDIWYAESDVYKPPAPKDSIIQLTR